MSRARNLHCRCRYGIPQAALTIPLANVAGQHGAVSYNFSPLCGEVVRTTYRMLGDAENGEVWETETAGSMIFRTGDPPRPYKLKTTINGFGVGGVVTEVVYTDTPGMVAEWRNMNPFEPNRGATMELKDFDKTATAVRWRDFECLRPAGAIQLTDCAGCDGIETSFMFVVEPPSFGGNTDFSDPFANDGKECVCRDYARTWTSGGEGEIGYPGCVAGVLFTGCEEGWSLPLGVALQIVDANSCRIVFGRTIDVVPIPLVEYWDVIVPRSACDVARRGGEFTLTYRLEEDWDCESHGDVKVTIVPLDANGEVTNGAPCGPKYCRGESLHVLRKTCDTGTEADYSWEELSSDCRGECADDSCRSTKPWELLPNPVSAEDATDAGYDDLVDGVPQLGGCACAAAPIDPACAEGCSLWEIESEYCGPGWLIYPRLVASCPPGECEASCVATPPDLGLPEYPITEEEGEEWPGGNPFDVVGQTFRGGCSCTATPYVPPECPTCDCLSAPHLTFTIAGVPAPYAFYNGEYQVAKLESCAGEGGNDEEGDCCWAGSNVDNGMVLAQGIWQGDAGPLVISLDGGVTYEADINSPCSIPTVAALVSSGSPTIPGLPPSIDIEPLP